MTYRTLAGRQFVVASTGAGADAALVAFALVPLDASSGQAQQPAQAQSAQSSGQAAFDRVCKVCHGPEARGDAGPRLVPFSREYEELLAIVREGTGQMPPISTRELPDESIAQVATYLKSLSR